MIEQQMQSNPPHQFDVIQGIIFYRLQPSHFNQIDAREIDTKKATYVAFFIIRIYESQSMTTFSQLINRR